MMPQLICSREGCDNEFYCRPARIKRNKTYGICCSKDCASLIRQQRITINCDNCDKQLERYPSKISDSNFCDVKCHGEYVTKCSLIELKCDNCGEKFDRRESYLKYQINVRNDKHAFCTRKCYEEHKKIYPYTLKLRNIIQTRRVHRKYREELHDIYLKELISDSMSLEYSEVTNNLIQLKRKQLKLYRLNNEKRKRLTQTVR